MKGTKPLQRAMNIPFSNSPNEKAAFAWLCDFSLKITWGVGKFFLAY